MFQRLINGVAWRKVGRGLKMLIEPIKYWQEASYYTNKTDGDMQFEVPRFLLTFNSECADAPTTIEVLL